MLTGINFFPTMRPAAKSAADYYHEAVELSVLAEQSGYSHIRLVEHYFRAYGGYSPSPLLHLAAIAARTSKIKLVTGAVIPAFTHPLKLAGELAMLDHLSQGRLEAGFARAFLPEEFDAFEVSLDESRQRFEEGITAVKRLWTENDVVFEGKYHHFGPLTMLPQPYQKPYPPIFIAAVNTPESFVWTGQQGYNLMVVAHMNDYELLQKNLNAYRKAYEEAGHGAGGGRVQITFHAYLAEDGATARREAEVYLDQYVEVFKESAAAWNNRYSDQYKGCVGLVQHAEAVTYERVLAETRAFIGDPVEVIDQIKLARRLFGEVELSLQIGFGNMPYANSLRTLELYARHVMPALEPSLSKS
jgi:alkanesulfonate monooxygenase SsuD/methylene tetrahydromethanopterin reductase-like flavin-dependent oxidoreductase (luciferase family)